MREKEGFCLLNLKDSSDSLDSRCPTSLNLLCVPFTTSAPLRLIQSASHRSEYQFVIKRASANPATIAQTASAMVTRWSIHRIHHAISHRQAMA